MPNSTASYAAAEFAQYDFSHSLLDFCDARNVRPRPSHADIRNQFPVELARAGSQNRALVLSRGF